MSEGQQKFRELREDHQARAGEINRWQDRKRRLLSQGERCEVCNGLLSPEAVAITLADYEGAIAGLECKQKSLIQDVRELKADIAAASLTAEAAKGKTL